MISPHKPGEGYIPGGLNELRDIYKRPYGDLKGAGKVGKIVTLTALLAFMTVSVGGRWNRPPCCRPKPVTPPDPAFPPPGGDGKGASLNNPYQPGSYLMAQSGGLDEKVMKQQTNNLLAALGADYHV